MKFTDWKLAFAGAGLLATVGLTGPIASSAAANDKRTQETSSTQKGAPVSETNGRDGKAPSPDLPQPNSMKVNVNSSVSLATLLASFIPSSPCTPDYTARFVIVANLTNIGAGVLGNPEFQVVELQQTTGTPPPNPYRLTTADDYVSCATGGVVGSTQQVAPAPFNFNPGATISIPFIIDLPAPVQPRPFRFIVNVFAVPGPVTENTPKPDKGLPKRKLGQLAIEVTGYDAAGEPQISTRFVPERKLPGGLRLDVQGVQSKLVRR